MPEIDEIKFVSIHDFKIADYEDYDIIISTEERKEKDKRIVVIPNILNETGISTFEGTFRQYEFYNDRKCNTIFTRMFYFIFTGIYIY